MKRIRILILCFVVIGGFLLGIYDHGQKTGSTSKRDIIRSESIATLQSKLTGTFSDYPNDTVSISLINLDSNKEYDFGSNEAMLGASTTKVIIAIDYLHRVELGQASLTQSVGGKSAKSQLQTMIEEQNIDSSDNAWTDFLSYLSFSQVTTYGQSIGATSLNSNNNTLTAHDEAIVFQKLFEGSLLNKSDTALMEGYLKNSAGNGLIAAALPKGAVIYHKYGYLYGYLHDASIITYKGRSFVLVIYTNNSSGNLNDNTQREQLFHSITQAVVQYEIS